MASAGLGPGQHSEDVDESPSLSLSPPSHPPIHVGHDTALSQLVQPASSGATHQTTPTPLQSHQTPLSNALATKPSTSTTVADDEERDTEDELPPTGISPAEEDESATLGGMADNPPWEFHPFESDPESNSFFASIDQDLMAQFPAMDELTIQEGEGATASLPFGNASIFLLQSGTETSLSFSSSVPPTLVQTGVLNVPHQLMGWPGQTVVQYIYPQVSITNDESGEVPTVEDRFRFLDITSFVRGGFAPRPGSRGREGRDLDLAKKVEDVTRDDLDGDRCDIQGINWESVNLSRSHVRQARSLFEAERKRQRDLISEAHKKEEEREVVRTPAAKISEGQGYFSLNRMNTSHRVNFSHFQLRNLIAATSRNDIYYSTRKKLMRTNVYGDPADCIMDLASAQADSKSCITTLAASDDILIAGGFEGDYAMMSLMSEYGTSPTVGRLTSVRDGITNHVDTYHSRSGGAIQAAFCSNDYALRMLDCSTNTFTNTFTYDKPINCSAISPNSRMRAVVGDFHHTLITNAETGESLQVLSAHHEDVFACAWADDGIHLATSAQDSKVVVWDARYWKRPVTVIQSELSVPRSLRFSPVGGGPRVLVSAEADDFINVIDAVTFEKKQTIDFFGPIAGITMTPDGSELFVANSDHKFGGIMAFERADWNSRVTADDGGWPEWSPDGDESLDIDVRVVRGRQARARRGLSLGSFVV